MIIGITGGTGCGKTTLLNILGGFEENYEGEYFFEGKKVGKLKGKEKKAFRQSIGYIFQSSLLMSNLTIMENLTYINNDRELISQYARQLNVEKLLDKRPDQLSGGERQRISVIRTLIQNPHIILADEPTASLDKLNSKDIAEIFAMLRNSQRVIIIATHESCFDDVADEIIHLGYGVIKSVENKAQSKESGSCNEVSEGASGIVEYATKSKGNSWRVMIPLIFRRYRDRFKLRAILPTILILVAILVCFAIQQNFKTELMKRVMGQYPVEVIEVMESEAQIIEEKYGIAKKYEPYMMEDELYVCARLLDKEDSVFGYGNLILCGKFPEKSNEVIVDYNTGAYLSGITHIEDCVGNSLYINDVEYIISAVAADMTTLSSGDAELYTSDVLYLNEPIINVYIPYDTIKKYGQKHETMSMSKTIKIKGLYEDKKMHDDIKNNILPGYISAVDSKISESEYMVNSTTEIIMASFVVVAIMAAIFTKNDIEVDLFYRRKELGYLQIFGVKKRTIWLQLILEKMAKNTICTAIAVSVYLILALIVQQTTGINGFIPVSSILLVVGIELGFTLISVLIPVSKYMRKSVLKLITE